MSLRRTDLRFALPRPVRRAVVLGDLRGWKEGFRLAGVEVINTRGSRVPDVAVAPARFAASALAAGAPQIILEGRNGARALSGAGLRPARYLPLPRIEAPSVILPLQRGSPVPRYVLRRWRPADGPLKHARDHAAAALIRAGAFPPLRPWQTIGARPADPPFLIQAASSLDVPQESSWYMTPGQGDPLTRGLFHIFPPGETSPQWVLKFARVAGYPDPFDRDEHGLRLAVESGGIVATHAPRLLGRLEVDGLHASVETAALGEVLATFLRRRPTAPSSIEAVEAISAWILGVARETAAPPAALTDERRRLAEEIVPRWTSQGAQPDLVDRLPEVPAVLQHNDVGTWNVVVTNSTDFVVIDWESARRHGLPLWDLLYFLTDALSALEGAITAEQRAAASIRLLRGDSPSSPILFKWVRNAVDEAGIPPDAVGAIATLGWLHHGLSHVPRGSAAERVEPGSAIVDPVSLIAPAWLRDPALGSSWSRWRG
jgi:Phosphotransferase enzyme family